MKWNFPVFFVVLFATVVTRVSGAELHPYLQWAQNQKVFENYNKYPYVTVFDSIIANVQKTGLSVVVRKTLYGVVNSEGASKLSTLVLDYDPLSAEIVVKNTFIIRCNGLVEPFFSGGRLYDYPAPARMIYWGARQIMTEPGKLNPGDLVYIEYVRKGFTYALLSDDDQRFIPPMRGHYYDIVEFFDNYPIHCKVFSVKLPKTKKFIYNIYHADFDVSVAEVGDYTQATFSLTNILPVEKEFRRVADSDIAPKVIVTTTERWEEKSKWFYGVNEDFGSFKSTPEIDAKVKEILKGAKDELDSVARLNRWVADEIRYSGISMGPGEGYTLHTGDMTFIDRCGVCKDKAGMLVTMLRAAGFESYAAMTMAGSRIENIPADQFNHSVTVVKLRNGSYMLLDPTWVPFVREMWSSREQQQNYLLGLPEGDILRETQISAPENHYLKISNMATIDASGKATGVFVIEAEGQSDATVRSIFTRSFMPLWEWNVRKQLLESFPGAVIEKVEFTDPYLYYLYPVSIKIHYSITDFAVVDKKTMIFKPLSSAGVFGYAQMYGSFNATKPDRKYPFTGNCSQLVEIKENYTFGEKIKSSSFGKSPQSFKGTFVSFAQSVRVKGKELSMSVMEKFNQRVYPAEAWSEFFQLTKARENFNKPVVVKF